MKHFIIIGVLVRFITCDALYYSNADCWIEDKFLNTMFIKKNSCTNIEASIKRNNILTVERCYSKPYTAIEVR